MLFYLIAPLLLSFLMTALLLRRMIPWLKKFAGQKILEIGPRWHMSKEGTPSMGGLAFLISMTVSVAVFGVILFATDETAVLLPLLYSFLYALTNGLVGIIDDRAKMKHKRNDGLTPLQKLVLQTVLALAYVALMKMSGNLTTVLTIPFTSVSFDLGYAYYFFATVLLVFFVNCANLTDGIDGLASSVAGVIAMFFAFASFLLVRDTALLLLASTMLGGVLGFLVYNWHPARVFMGDTGSLFLGALASSMCFMLGNPLIILLVGIIYLIEGVSVMLQVGFYKLTKKRLFKMAPIHHHFEKCGWGEVKIVCVFSLITVLGSLAIYFGISA